MNKLLTAGLWRLRKSKISITMIVLTIIAAILFIMNSYINNFKYNMDSIVFSFSNFIGFFIAMFTSLFAGIEYDYGTIRNKIIVGHSRSMIYLSTLILNIIVAVLLQLIYILVVVIIGIPLHGTFSLTVSQIVVTFVYLTIAIICYTTIFNFISIICKEITLSTIINIALILIMFISVQLLGQVINEREFTYLTVHGENGEIISQEINGKNPDYPGEKAKEICRKILYIIPTGQVDTILSNKENIDNQVLLYSITVSIIVNILGVIIFEKKELR